MAPAELAPPSLAVPVLVVQIESAPHGLKQVFQIAVEGKEFHLHKLITALRHGGILAEASDQSTHEELRKFADKVQHQENQRQEVHSFYTEVAKQFARMGETMMRMRKEYYQEIDHLRNQLSLKKRDPRFVPDNIIFFDPTAYQIPPWREIVSQLDGLRMKRELLKTELGGERIQTVPLHMLCQCCRRQFQSPEEEEKFRRERFREMESQTEGVTCAGSAFSVRTMGAQTDLGCANQDMRAQGHSLIPQQGGDVGSMSNSDAEWPDGAVPVAVEPEAVLQKRHSHAKRKQAALSKKELASRIMERRLDAFNKHLMRCAFAQLKQNAGIDTTGAADGCDDNVDSLQQPLDQQTRPQLRRSTRSTTALVGSTDATEYGDLIEPTGKMVHKYASGEDLPEALVGPGRGRHSQITSTHSRSASGGAASNSSASRNGRSKRESKANKRRHSRSGSEHGDTEDHVKPVSCSADSCEQVMRTDGPAQHAKHQSAKVMARRLEAHRRHQLRYAFGRLRQGGPKRESDVQESGVVPDEILHALSRQSGGHSINAGPAPREGKRAGESMQVCAGSEGACSPCDTLVGTGGVGENSIGCRIALARPVLDAGPRVPGSSPDACRKLGTSASSGALPRIPSNRPPEGHMRPHAGSAARPGTREPTPVRPSMSHRTLPQLTHHGSDFKKRSSQHMPDASETGCGSEARRDESQYRLLPFGQQHQHQQLHLQSQHPYQHQHHQQLQQQLQQQQQHFHVNRVFLGEGLTLP